MKLLRRNAILTFCARVPNNTTWAGPAQGFRSLRHNGSD
jgi:hypothetical protein